MEELVKKKKKAKEFFIKERLKKKEAQPENYEWIDRKVSVKIGRKFNRI